MLRKVFRKEFRYLGTAASVVLALMSPLQVHAVTWANCNTGISDTSASAVTVTTNANSCVIQFKLGNTWTVPDGVNRASVAIVGAGGGGGFGNIGGGGGGGEVMYNPSLVVSPGSVNTIGIGTGGSGGWNLTQANWAGGTRGGTTQFGSYYAGGGFGGPGNTVVSTTPSSVYGGSGSGTSGYSTSGQMAVKQSLTGWTSYANNGGSYNGTAGGGGGAGTAGAAGTGGNGITLPSPLAAYTLAGGGGGWTGGAGGTGGGGKAVGANYTVSVDGGTNGTANTGGGGGAGMAGGSGTVILQYYTSQTVSFNANGGTGTMASATLALGSTLPANTFTRSGYVFKGWATSASGQVVVADQAQTPNTGDITYYAVWAGTNDQAVNLNATGTADYLSNTTAQSVPATSAFSVEAWVKPTSFLSYGTIFSQGTGTNRFWLRTDASGNIQVFHDGGTSPWTSTAKIPLNVWSHVAASLDGTNLYIYLNGQLIYSGAYSWGSTAVAAGVYIGELSTGPTDTTAAWKGQIDQVKVWGSALSQAQIQRSMNAFSDSDSSGQIASTLRDAWSFNEGSGVTPNDATSSVSLSVSGSPTFASVPTIDSVKGIYTFPRTFLAATGGFVIPGTASYDYLVVAGGGGGGDRAGGGGGAGGYLSSVGGAASSRLSLSSGSVVNVVVGTGGYAYTGMGHGVSGNNSQLAPVSGSTFTVPTAIGGGGGGTGSGGCIATGYIGYNGGSGGGSDGDTNCSPTSWSNPGTGTAGQGNSGGRGSNGGSAANWTGGGGGGAGAVGGAGSTSGVAGSGGAGVNNGITGTKVCYAAGGGGGAYIGYTAGSAGGCSGNTSTGGSGSAGDTAANSALANTGSGGGGSGFNSLNGTPGSGGSGLVVLRASVSSITQPTFDTPIITGTGTGFTVNVNNYDPYYTYSATITAGSVSIGALNGSSLPLTVTGLTAGQNFTLNVTATDGSLTSSTASLNPPNAPTSISVRPGDKFAKVTFSQVTDSTRPLTGYQYSLDGGTTWNTAAQNSSPLTIPGLTNGTSYTLVVRGAGAGYGSGSTVASLIPGLIWDVWAKDYNSGTGVWTDSSIGANNVTATGTVPTSSTYPSAVNFTGNTYFYHPTTYNGSTDAAKFSVGAWFKTTSSGKIIGLQSVNGYDHHMYVGSNGYLYGGVVTGSSYTLASSNAAVNDGTWRYAVYTFDGTTSRLYINGVLQSTTATQAGVMVNYTSPWIIGGNTVTSWPSAGNGYFTGSVGHAFVYHRALSGTEITNLYTAEAAPYTPIAVNYAAGTGTGTMAATSVLPGNAFNVPTTASFTKAGYFLSGWNDGTATYLPGASYTMPTSGSVTLTAQWSYTSGNMTFSDQLGNTSSTTFQYYGGVTVSTAVRTGYVLKGWSTDAAGTNIVGSSGSNYKPWSTTNLQLSYNMDDSSSYNGFGSTVTDMSPTAGLNGTISGSPTFTPGSSGYLTLTGTTSGGPYVVTPNLYSRVGVTDVSMFGWIYATGDGVVVDELGTPTPDSGWHDSQIEVVGGKLKVRMYNGVVLTSAATVTGAWHYVGFTFSGTTLTGYIDGASFGSGATTRDASGLITSSTLYYAVGGVSTSTNLGSGSAGNFRLGSFQVYNAGLSATTVSNNFQASCTRFSVAGCTGQTLYAQWLAAAAAPTVSTPTSTTRSVGATATFNTVASTTDGGTLTYQWAKNGTDIAGATSPTYTTPTLVAGDNNATFSVRVTNTLYSGQTYQSQTVTTSGTATLTVGAAPTITTPSGTALNATYNSSYTLDPTFTVASPGKTFALASGTVPTGMTFNTTSGRISGTPTATGTFTVLVRVTDDYGVSATTSAFGIVVAKASQTITFGALANKTLGTGTFTVSATSSNGSTVSFSTANNTYCSVTGTTVTLVAVGTCSIRADQPGDTNWLAATQVVQSFTIANALTITTPSTGLGATYNSAYTLTVGTSGGATPLTFAIATGTLPTGLSLNTTTGVISGTPSAVGTQTISVRATDANGATATTSSFAITVAKAAQTITFNTIAARTLNAGTLTLAPTASSGLAVTLTPTNTAICTVSGFVVTFLTSGTCSLTASQAGDGNYLAATSVIQTVTISGVTVTFNSNYGTVTTSNQSITTAGAQALNANPFSRTGYTFAGWATNADGSGTTYANGQGVTLNADTTLYAQWAAGSFTITYNYNAATGGNTNATDTFTTGGTSITLPTPTKSGYVFAGWYSDSIFTTFIGAGGASYSPTASATIYAKWLVAAATPTATAPTGATKTSGQSITFTTAGSTTDGGTLTYQWYKDGTAILGATGSSYNIASLAVGDAGSYTVTVINTLYSGQTYQSQASVTSSAATLTVVGAPTITTPSAGLNATYNNSYSLSITGSTNTTGKTFSVIGSLPGGLTIAGATGVISGTPTAAGTFAVQVRITDDNGATAITSSFSIVVAKATQSITFGALANKTMGQAAFAVSATASSGNAVSFTSANLGVCTVSGSTVTLVAAGTCSIRADQAGDGNWNVATQVVQDFTVASALTITTPSSGLTGTYNAAFSLTLGTGGGAGTNTFALVNGTLPTGLSLNTSTGVISGTPTAAGSQTISVRVTDANTATATTADFQLVIAKSSQTISFGAIANRGLNDGTLTLSPSASSGLAVTLTPTNTAICAVSGLVVTFLTSGTCTLTASQAGNANYNAAASVPQSLTVSAITVTFDSNYGTATTSTQTITTAGPQALTANGVSRSGYTFVGWTTAADGTGTSYTNTQSVTLTTDATLYAQWTANSQTVTYVVGTGATGTAPTQANTATAATFTVAAGTGLAKTGYSFGGWSNGATNYAAGATYTMGASNVTLTAIWTPNTYVVTYSYNSATGGNTTASGSFTTGGSAMTLPTPTRSGYSFAGWYDDSVYTNLIGLGGAGYSPNGTSTAITIYAKWTVASSIISYDANGGSGSATATTGNTLSTVTVGNGAGISRGGYTLVGWNTAADMSGTAYGAGNSLVMPAGGITLYADWNANSYSVTYNSGGGSAVASGSYSTAGSITLPAAPTFAGYSFAGWFVAASGGSALGATYAPSGYGNITIYAQWTANAQTIGYNANSGTGSIASVSTVTGATVSLDPGTLMVRTGYTLLKWNTSANGSGTDYALSASATVPATGLTLYAIWQAINYGVTYNANGATSGTAPTDATNYNIGQSITVLANSNLVRTGYTFAGWNTQADGAGTTYASGNRFTVGSASVTLYAKWTANTYTVTYNANGASGSAARSGASVTSDSYTTAGATVTLPDVGTMAKRGYNFGGWSTSAGGSALASGTAAAYTATANVTLYAVWTIKTVAITYSKGTMASATFISFPADGSGNYATTITVGNGVDSNVTLNSTRYDFMGWSDGTSVYAAGSPYVLSDTPVSFTAIWVPVYAVRYIFNGGTAASGESALDTECVGTDGTCVNLTSITTNNAPSRAGYTFTGWTDQSNLSVAANSSYTVTDGHYLLYAQWTAINYHINYVADGGSTAPTQADKNIGGVFTVGSAITKTGYSFAGWNDGNLTYGAGATYTVSTSDVTLTARWTPDIYSVNYDWNGGHGSAVSADYFTVGTGSVTLPLVTDHVKDGYNFNGWSTTAGGSLLGSTYVPTANTTLYAIWGAGSYTLTMNANGGSVATGSYSVANGTAQTLPDATRAHFHFDGWYPAAGTSSRIGGSGDSYTPSGSSTLYAHWTQDSLFGMGAATRIGSFNTTSGIATGFTAYGANNSAAIYVPADALPAATQLDVYLLADTSRAASLIGGAKSYLVNLVVSWLASDGTVPTTAVSKEVRVTITDPNIKAGAAVYSLIGSTATYLGTATVDGSVTVYITDDPELVVAASVPSAPLSASATAVDGVATVTWTTPTSTGGSPITSYLVTASNGATCAVGVGTNTCDIHNLTNGLAYTFTVQAINSVGTSQASAATASVTPMATQTISFAAPTNVTLNAGTSSLSAAASSGLTVTLASATTSVCSVSGTTVTLLSAGTCTITANQTGDYRTLAAAQVSQSFTFAPTLVITTPTSGLSGAYNSAYSLTMSTTGGAGSNTFAVASGTLPAGLSLDTTTGVISGTPTTSANSSVAISVTDANGTTVTTSAFNLVINTIAQSALTLTSTSGTYGTGVTLAATGGTTNGAISYATVDGTTSCTISSGVLTAAGAGTCLVTATMAGSALYSPVSTSQTTVTFAQAAQAALSVTSLSGTYGTNLQLSTSGGSGIGAVSYSVVAGSTSCTIAGGYLIAAGAGSCTVTATKSTDANYLAATSAAVSVVFAMANQSALTLTSTAGTYGSSLTLQTSGGSSTGAVSYVVTDGTTTCTLNAGILTVAGAGTCTVTATRAADANYNAVSTSATTVTFVMANQSALSVSSTSGTYGTGLTLTTSGGSSTGSVSYSVANGTATCTLTNGVLTVSAAGTCSVTATRGADANYNAVSSQATTVTFAHAPQSITFAGLSNQTLAGGAAANVASATASSGLTVTFSSLTSAVCSISAGTVSLIAAGTCTIAADQAGDTGYAAASRVTQSFTVAPALVLTTPTTGLTGSYNSSYSLAVALTGGAGTKTFAIASGSLPAGLSLNTATGVISGVPSVSGTGTVTISVTDANGATASTGSFSIVVNTIAQTALTVTSTSGTFGSPVTLVTIGGSVNAAASYSVASGTTTCTLSGSSLTASGAGTCIVTATLAGDAYYSSVSSSSTTVTFAKAAQGALILSSISGTYGTPLTLATSGGSGIGAVSYTVAAGTTTCTISGGNLTAAGAGSCTVTATKATDADYLVVSSNATTVTFAVAGQSAVLVTSTSGTYGTDLTLAASGGSGTGAFSFTVAAGTTTCTLSNGVLTPAASGTCSVTATRAADANYGSASSVATTVTFAHAAQTISFGALPNQTLGNASATPITLAATASSGLTASFTSLTLSVCTVSAGIVQVAAAGTCTIAADQTGDARYAAATRVTQSLTVSPALTLATPATGLSGQAGSAFSLLLVDAGGAGNHVFSLLTGTLPAGINLNTATGLISGSAAAAGSVSISVRVTDANGATADTAAFTFTFAAAPAPVAPPTVNPIVVAGPGGSIAGRLNSAVSASVSATGGSGNFIYSYSGRLPAGVNLNAATGAISGTATQAGNFTVIVSATDSSGNAGAGQAFTFVIAKADQAALSAIGGTSTLGKTIKLGAAGGSGTGAISFAISSDASAACILSGDTVTASVAGSCTVIAIRAGDDNFNAASSAAVTVTFTAVPVAPPAVETWGTPVVVNLTEATVPVAVQDGVATAVTTVVTNDNLGLTMTTPEWQITLKTTQPTTASGGSTVGNTALVVNVGSTVDVAGDKFQGNSVVQVWVYSTPTLIGTVQVRADGSFATQIKLPAGLEVGNHTLVLQGLNSNQKVQTAQAPMLVQKPQTTPVTPGGSSTSSVRVLFASTNAHVTPRIAAAIASFAKSLKGKTGGHLLGTTYYRGKVSIPRAKFLCALRAQRVSKLLKRAGVKAAISCAIKPKRAALVSQIFDLAQR